MFIRTSSLLGVGESLSIELYDDDELLLARSELMRRAVGGPRDDDNSTDWNSSHRRLKRLDGPTDTTQFISRAHSFMRAAEFRAKPQNFPFAAEFWYFHGILQQLKIQWRLVRFLTWWRVFITEKIKLNCQKQCALLIAMAIWRNHK